MAAKCYVQLPAKKQYDFPMRFEITHAQIEREMNVVLNKARSYLVCNEDGKTHIRVICSGSAPCSGCHESYDNGPGMGCSECGYTGMRRHSMWVPALDKDDEFQKADYKQLENDDESN